MLRVPRRIAQRNDPRPIVFAALHHAHVDLMTIQPLVEPRPLRPIAPAAPHRPILHKNPRPLAHSRKRGKVNLLVVFNDLDAFGNV